MAIDQDKAAHVALNRFGLGARAGDLASARSDPRGFLRAELDAPRIADLTAGDLPSSVRALQDLFEFQEGQRIAREQNGLALKPPDQRIREAAPPPDVPGLVPTNPMMSAGQAAEKRNGPNVVQEVYRSEAKARAQRWLDSQAGFTERLVAFWANHFCVSVDKGQFVRISAGAFEREAIRPHVLGRFADMVRAVEQHPTMLFFLDNAQSIGPNSRAGQNRRRGLNENLAREIMELHTLGVNGGYSQADVTSLAKIITGWTFVGRQARMGDPGTFVFNANAHEPGIHRLLGVDYRQGDRAQGEAALDALARHPATARFIATKLARHFHSDAPPDDVVERLRKRFMETDGDLRQMALALIGDEAIWTAPPAKIRSPQDYLAAIVRITGRVPPEPGPILFPMAQLGAPLWGPSGPNGFADTLAQWMTPEGMKVRMDIAAQAANRLRDTINPLEALDQVAGEAASEATRTTIRRAESKPQGLALLLMSPEVQRR